MQLSLVLTLLGVMSLQQLNCAPVTAETTPATTTTSKSGSTAIPSVTASKKHKKKNKKGKKGSAPKSPASTVAAATSAVPTATSQDAAPSVSTTAAAAPLDTGAAPSSGSLNVTKEQFLQAWTAGKAFLPDPNISAPTDQQYKAFISNAATAGGISSNTELAMFLAEIMWESGGLVYKSELACAANGPTPNCPGSYQDSTGLPGKYYYGRGYIQLSWGANYKAASQDLFQNDTLLKDPDQVASNEDYAWDVSFWYWKSRVKPTLNNTFNFGLATKAINGSLECSGDSTKAKKRFSIYKAILAVFEPSATPIESGCYN